MGGNFNLSQNGWGIAGEGEERITTFGGGQRTPMNSDKSRAGREQAVPRKLSGLPPQSKSFASQP
jgi:hypothetical protein